MNKLIVPLAVVFAFIVGGCDRKAPDNMNPKTSLNKPGTTAPGSPQNPNDTRSSSQAKN
jgi:hypothetical protein